MNQQITARILADTVSPVGARITTFEVSCPLHVHVQMLTHRAFSRNAQSNRAIPTKILMKERAIYVPSFWGKNKKGMSPDGIEVSDTNKRLAVITWKSAMLMAKLFAKILSMLGVHKETANRLLAPFIMVKSIITSTDFDNFFNLRIHGAAQNEIMDVAMKMRAQYMASKPETSYIHIPLLSVDEQSVVNNRAYELSSVGICSNKLKMYAFASRIFKEYAVKAAVGRCARVSYLTHDAFRDPTKDIKLHDDLLKDKHMSPFEHVAVAASLDDRHGNLRGWYSYRTNIERGNQDV